MNQPFRRRNHHLRPEAYRGQICVSFTGCIKGGRPIFKKSEVVATFLGLLRDSATNAGCVVPVYSFMPEHLHVVIKGMTERSSAWDAIIRFKQGTGYWLRQNLGCEWQKDFYDHIIRRHESFPRHILYVVNNPVRRGLVATWEEYPYTGSIGLDLKEVLSDISLK